VQRTGLTTVIRAANASHKPFKKATRWFDVFPWLGSDALGAGFSSKGVEDTPSCLLQPHEKEGVVSWTDAQRQHAWQEGTTIRALALPYKQGRVHAQSYEMLPGAHGPEIGLSNRDHEAIKILAMVSVSGKASLVFLFLRII
jgi:hypothetical protein